MGNAANVKMGICQVLFNNVDLGFTSGGVKIDYSADTSDKTVDQMDVPISQIVTKQKFTAKVPLAEFQIASFVNLFPGAATTETTKGVMTLSGAAGTDLITLSKKLILKPIGLTAADYLTIFSAGPQPNISYSYEKTNVRIYEVTFAALINGFGSWVAFGDTSLLGLNALTTTSAALPKAGDATVTCVLRGSGFMTNGVMTAGLAASIMAPTPVTPTITVLDDCTLTFPLPATSTAVVGTSYGVKVVTTANPTGITLASAITFTA